jgi:hypothetical protein
MYEGIERLLSLNLFEAILGQFGRTEFALR